MEASGESGMWTTQQGFENRTKKRGTDRNREIISKVKLVLLSDYSYFILLVRQMIDLILVIYENY